VLDDSEIVEDVQLHRIDGKMEDVGVLNLPDSIHELHCGRLPVLLTDFGLHSGIAVEELGIQNNLCKLRKLLPKLLKVGFGEIAALEVRISELDLVSDLHFFWSVGLLSACQGVIGVSETRIVLTLGNSFDWLWPRDNCF